MSKQVLVPLGGRLQPQVWDPDPDDPEVLFDIEIPIRVDVSSDVDREFFAHPDRTTVVSLEDVDLGVSDWRQLPGKDVVFPKDQELDAAVYLATVHNPVKLRRIRFGKADRRSIRAGIDLEFDFRCVNPRPPELRRSFRVHWEIDFEVVADDEDSES
jgi:hypothetical protein